MRAIGQITITNICDVIASDTPPENPYIGQLWVDTSVNPPETKVWNGDSWEVQNDLETIRVAISVLTTRSAELQSTIDGLNSYVGSMTQTIETITDSLGNEQQTVLEMQAQMSQLQQTIDGLTIHVQSQYAGGLNFIQNSAGLNGVSDDWVKTGTVTVDTSTDTQNNTTSDSCFVLGTSSTLKQTVTGLVTGQSYAFSLRAKKTASSYSSYIRVQYNGNKYAYFFNQTTTFGWPGFQSRYQRHYRQHRRVLHLQPLRFAVRFGHHDGRRPHRPQLDASTERDLHERSEDRQARHRRFQRGVLTADGHHEHGVRRLLQRRGHLHAEQGRDADEKDYSGRRTDRIGKTKFVPMSTASDGLNIVILD